MGQHGDRRSPRPQPALGMAIRAMRVERAETQRALAAAAGMSVAHLSKVEHGITNPTWASVTAIAAALRSPVHELAVRFEEVDAARRPIASLPGRELREPCPGAEDAASRSVPRQ